MSKSNLLFFVNGLENSAASVRAKTFASKFSSDWFVEIKHRPLRKWHGIIQFIFSALYFRPKIIYVMDTAYAGVLAGYISKMVLGCQLIVDTGDVAFELAKSKQVYSNTQLFLINWVEQIAIHHSSCLIVRGSHHKEYLTKKNLHHVEFIPDGVDVGKFDSIYCTSLKQELGLEGCFVVGLVGTMTWSERHQMCYGWDIVEALAYLKDMPIRALLIGDGDGRAFLERQAEKLGIRDNITFVGTLPYEKLPHYLSVIDVCVSTQSNDLVGQVRTTGKLPLYLACGKYVIATDVGEARNVLPDVGCLLPYKGVKDMEHPTRLAGKLRTLALDPSSLCVSDQAKQIARDNFDYEMLALRVEKIFYSLIVG